VVAVDVIAAVAAAAALDAAGTAIETATAIGSDPVTPKRRIAPVATKTRVAALTPTTRKPEPATAR
jgi:hypothetical protein